MPRGDGTGPLGLGPMTGRAMGYCAGFPVPGYLNPGYGWGWFGRGRGLGWRRWRRWAWAYPGWVYPPAVPFVPFGHVDAKAQAEFLRDQAQVLEEELKAIRARLEELEKEKKE
ncbi:MAG: DUF5320 domain-containing protein [Bacillota bacterium]